MTSAVVNPATLTVSSDGMVFQAVLGFSDGTTSGTVIVTDPLTGWINGSDGYSWTPVTTSAPVPAISAQAPATQTAPVPVSSAPATAPAPATSTLAPAPAPTWTVFACAINGAFSQPIGSSSSFTVTNTSGSSVATVIDIAVSGNGVQTETVKAPSGNSTWPFKTLGFTGAPNGEVTCTAGTGSAS